jgi:hypothetical protein
MDPLMAIRRFMVDLDLFEGSTAVALWMTKNSTRTTIPIHRRQRPATVVR